MKYIPVQLLSEDGAPAQEADQLQIITRRGVFTVQIDSKTGWLEVRSALYLIDVHPLSENCVAIVTRR